MKTKIIVVVRKGCVSEVYSDDQSVTGGTSVEVIDLDGDYRAEGERKIAKLEKSDSFIQVWP